MKMYRTRTDSFLTRKVRPLTMMPECVLDYCQIPIFLWWLKNFLLS